MEMSELEKYFVTKVDLMAFREEVAVQFGKVHVAIADTRAEIARLEGRMAATETRLIKWFLTVVIANTSIALAIARYLS
jgi:BMFP domain-containing protein YqiC